MAQFSEDVRGDVCVVQATGDIDLAAIVEFMSVVRGSLERCSRVEIDLGGVAFIDSSGLGALVRLRKESGAQGTSVHLVNVNEATERLFELTGLADVLDFRTSQD